MPENLINEGLMESYFNSDPSDFEEPPFHLITTSHPWMAELGLSSFTTGILYRWWNEKDGEGNFVNQIYFDPIGSPVASYISPQEILLGNNITDNSNKDSDQGRGQFAFQAWRKEDNGAGSYQTLYADGGHDTLWSFNQPEDNEADQPKSYTYNDLFLSEYDAGFIKEFSEEGRLFTVGTSFEIPDGKGGKEDVEFQNIDPITQLISLNQWINNYQDTVIDKSLWSQSDFARSEFILDIQSSKEGYVEWSGYVPFQISLGSGDAGDLFKCTKADWVKFRLYLYPNGATKNTRRGVAMAKPLFAAPPVDSLGRRYQNRDDGRFSAFPEGSRAAEVAGELDMTYNEYTGKWEAGSQQMVAVVTQPITAAQQVSTDKLRNLKPEEMLKNPTDPNSHIIWGSGGAMPLSMQNGNPMQWTPNYAQASETDSDGKFTIICPEESEEKAQLKVFNASSKELGTDQYVLLNKIDGLWFAIDFPSGVEQFTQTQPGFDGLWDFYYCATNVVHYFRDSGFNRIDSNDIELGFHKDFYADTDGTREGDADNYNFYGEFTATNTLSLASGGAENKNHRLIPGGYHQFSSFDMMDNQIGGTRTDGNKYAVTNPLEGPNGEITDSEANGTTTGAFFGCIFPDGYSNTDISEYTSNRNFVATPTVAISGKVDDGNKGVGRWVSSTTNTRVGSTEYRYFHDGGIDTGVKPFQDGEERSLWQMFKDEENKPVAMFKDGDNKLTNLPADIALNASPLGAENGQPLTNLHFIERMYFPDNAALANPIPSEVQRSTRNRVKHLFSFGKNWLYRKVGEGVDANNSDFTTSSAFDFKPRKNNRIMFRPLKAEIYAQFAELEYNSAAAPKGRQKFAQSFAVRSNLKRPSSEIAYQRELSHDKAQGIVYDFDGVGGPDFDVAGKTYPLYNDYWGLQMNIDIPRSPTNFFSLSPKASLMGTNNRFHWNSWGRGSHAHSNRWCYGEEYATNNQEGLNYPWRFQADPFGGGFSTADDKDSFEGAGAVGIIGAVATCTANTNIRTSASCRLGIWSWSTFDSVNALTNYPAWGKGNTYRSFNTTNLHVKVYHHWPREQTIYDPRYFAVHHFNAGILDETVSAEDDSYKIYKEIEELPQKDPNDVNGGSRNYKYQIHQLARLGVDLQVPCSKQHSGDLLEPDEINEAVELKIGSRMYGTRSYNGESTYSDTTYSFSPHSNCESLERTKWNIDPKRRGKLLPYNYKYTTVRIPRFIVELPDYDDGVDDEDNEFIYANGGYAIINTNTVTIGKELDGTIIHFHNTKAVAFYDKTKPEGEQFSTFNPLKAPFTEDVLMVVKNPGKGEDNKYQLNDTFVTPIKLGQQAEIKVTEVDAKGRIKKFHVYISGGDFSNTGFTNVTDDKPISRTSTGINLASGGTKETENGSGFSAYIVRGEVVEFGGRDEKPFIATSSETIRLSPKANAEDIQAGQGATPFGLDSATELQDILIDTKASGDKYDLFFHFHNDISHTFMLNDWKGNVDRWNNDEQYIDLTISTN